MNARRPRTIEEDVRSEIGASEIGHVVPKEAEAYYTCEMCTK